jgi:hypothetical protein
MSDIKGGAPPRVSPSLLGLFLGLLLLRLLLEYEVQFRKTFQNAQFR